MELRCIEKVATSNGKCGAISNDDMQVRRNRLACMEMSGIIGHMERGSRVE